MGKALVCKNLEKTYQGGSTPAINGLEISIAEEQIYGLLGPNGAGKTTTISILSTLMRPDRGEVEIFGLDAIRRPFQVRKIIGLVPQDIALYGNLTAKENLRYFGKIHGLTGKDLKQRIDFCLDLVGLNGHGDRRVNTYSGGMKRRANLAAGILHKPRLLFLDEPTVGIDAQSRNMILEKLAELKEAGMTMIYTTHYMEEAEKLCDKVDIIDEGRVIAQGSPEALIERSPDYQDLNDLFLSLTGKNLRD